jgi:hypothetical protein
MAEMVTEPIPSVASQGEKTLYGILRDNLPDDFYVWYEPKIEKLYPDFIILGPSFGLLIIEVKGWYPNCIVAANHDFFQIKYVNDGKEKVEAQQSPLRQCRGYFGAVLDRLKQYSVLTNPDGDYQGKLVFPTGYGAVMSNITTEQAHRENIYQLLEQPQVAYRDELLAWSEFSEKELIKRFKQMFTVQFPFMALTQDQISTIRGVIYPETVIIDGTATRDSVPETVSLQPNSLVLKTLDIEQEKLARKLGRGHRLFYGVAGSGKTVILLSRAKYLANHQPESRILVLCYNIALASYLQSLIHDDPQNPQYQQIQVMHFHAWAKSVLKHLPNPEQISGDYDELLGERLKAAIANFTEAQKWDAILVDESHTFSPSWFKCCVAALKDSDNGDLMIVSDGSQSIHKRLQFTWKSVDVKAVGRSRKLSKNYRNTQEILSVAWSIVQSISNSQQANGDVTFPVVEPSAAQRHGNYPTLRLLQSRTEEVEAVIQLIRHLQKSGYEPKDIAIIYRHKARNDQHLFNNLIQQLNDSGFESYWVTKDDESKQYSTKEPGVRIITALSSLGLEFKVIIILWVQQFANCHASDPELSARERRQLYVAMTRAQEELHIFGSGNVPIIDELNKLILSK